MPCAVAEEARRQGRPVIGIGIVGITDPHLADLTDEIHWLQWGDVGAFLAMLNQLHERGVTEAVMAGKVEQQRIYEQPENDKMKGLLSAVPVRHTDSLLQAVVKIMGGADIELLESTRFLQSFVVRQGTLTHRSADDREHADMLHGWRVAKELGALDIGQAVVIKDRAVVAVEAMEGTDACLRRAASLAGPGTVLVKVAKPDQDLRFDVPVVGAETVALMAEVGSTALCIEADVTVVFDRDALCAAANDADIAVVARRGG